MTQIPALLAITVLLCRLIRCRVHALRVTFARLAQVPLSSLAMHVLLVRIVEVEQHLQVVLHVLHVDLAIVLLQEARLLLQILARLVITALLLRVALSRLHAPRVVFAPKAHQLEVLIHAEQAHTL